MWKETDPQCTDYPFKDLPCIDIIDWYDGPLMWVAEDNGSSYFVYLWGDHDRFLVARTENKDVRGKLLWDVLQGKLWIVDLKGDGITRCWEVTIDDLPEDSIAPKDCVI